MSLVPPLKLFEDDKLEVLRRLDRHRNWRALDDKRYCLGCGKIITGRNIRVTNLGSDDTVRAVCPTEGCKSIPMDWAVPTDEMLARLSITPLSVSEFRA
jgi:hypothetical protein